MKRDIVDPAPLGVGRKHLDLALGVKACDLAVIAAGDNAFAVGSDAQDAAAMHGNRSGLCLARDDEDALFRTDKGRLIAHEMHGAHGRANRNGAHLVGDGNDGSGFARLEIGHRATMQLSKPSRIIASGNSRPMKTRRLRRGSPSFHGRW